MNDMSKGLATKHDIHDLQGKVRGATDDVLQVLDIMAEQIDLRFQENEKRIVDLQISATVITNQLDNLHKNLEISEDERLVIAYQLTKIQMWVEKAAKRIGLQFEN